MDGIRTNWDETRNALTFSGFDLESVGISNGALVSTKMCRKSAWRSSARISSLATEMTVDRLPFYLATGSHWCRLHSQPRLLLDDLQGVLASHERRASTRWYNSFRLKNVDDDLKLVSMVTLIDPQDLNPLGLTKRKWISIPSTCI